MRTVTISKDGVDRTFTANPQVSPDPFSLNNAFWQILFPTNLRKKLCKTSIVALESVLPCLERMGHYQRHS